ncbi:MAG: DUF1028 domain-containing protein [Nitrososphaerales archaeon]
MTYSIVARDPKTGEMGVAVQSHYFSVGSVVTWARAGVGSVATQSMAELSYGPLGLELMAAGKSPEESLGALLKADPKAETRQVAFVDSKGRVAAHTGNKCIPFAGHTLGDQFSCQANLMSNDTIWSAMDKAYRDSPDLTFPERLVLTLEAAEAAGGDIRGKQSAALLIVSPDLSPNYWSGKVLELRVEDHPEPLVELKRLLRIRRAYEWADKGDDLLSSGKIPESKDAFEKAYRSAPEIDELQYWRGITLLGTGRIDEAKSILYPLLKRDARWIQVTRSLGETGMVRKDTLDKFLSEI